MTLGPCPASACTSSGKREPTTLLRGDVTYACVAPRRAHRRTGRPGAISHAIFCVDRSTPRGRPALPRWSEAAYVRYASRGDAWEERERERDTRASAQRRVPAARGSATHVRVVELGRRAHDSTRVGSRWAAFRFAARWNMERAWSSVW